MGVGQSSTAAATAVLGYDLATGQQWQQQNAARGLTGFAITGSAAAGDTKVDLFVDTVKVGEFFNTTTGFPTQDHVVEIDAYVPPGAQIHVYVTDAASTNPINLLLTWDELEE